MGDEITYTSYAFNALTFLKFQKKIIKIKNFFISIFSFIFVSQMTMIMVQVENETFTGHEVQTILTSTQEYVIDYSKVKTLEDVIKVLERIDLRIPITGNVKGIEHLVKEQKRYVQANRVNPLEPAPIHLYSNSSFYQ